jgi:hypothetical protein
MSSPQWPEDLPAAPLAEGFQETWPDLTLRSQTDMGPAKTRPRSTAGVGKLLLAYHLTAAQYGVLKNFYQTDLAGGSLRFDMPHPVGGATVACRFIKPPAPLAVTSERFKVMLELEVLP